MQPARVYQRRELERFSANLGRDLKRLVASGKVRRPARGLYYRPKKCAFGPVPADDAALMKAYLKTDDFLLMEFHHYNSLGLGLTQLYNVCEVYNKKLSGMRTLDRKRFRFHKARAYPRVHSRESLLVSMLNNLMRLPDNVELVLKNLKKGLKECDQAELSRCLRLYANRTALRLVREARAR